MTTWPSTAEAEIALYSRALSQLNLEHDPAAALATLSAYGFKYPNGILRGEAIIAQIKAELMLGLDVEVLGLLDAMEEEGFPGVPQVAEARLLRVELLVQRGRCQDATKALEQYLEPSAPLEQRERALVARASCRAQIGDFGGAREDLLNYLDSFPNGRFFARVLETLAGLPLQPGNSD